MRRKAENVLKRVFSVGISICITVAFIVALMFVAAFIVGGDTAVWLVDMANTYVLKVLYYAGTCMGLVGIVKMYVAGEKAYTMDIVSKEDMEKAE